MRTRTGRTARWIALAALVAMAVPLSPLTVDQGHVELDASPVADAADGPPNTLQAVNKTVNVSTASPNATLAYSISYSCPGVVAGGTCATGKITDPLPTYTDIDGNTRQLTYVSSTTTSHFSAGAVSGTSPNQVVTWNATSGLVAGTSGVLTLTVRVPRGLVPVASQVVSNVATATLSGVTDDSPAATTTISASGTDWTFTKTQSSATPLLNANVTYSLKVCPTPNTAALPPSVEILDTLPEGATFVSATAGGSYTDNASPAADTVAWTIDSSNRPSIDSNGCFTVTTIIKFVPPGSGGDATNQTGVVKTNSATATVGGTVKSASVNLTLTGPATRISRSKSVGVGGTYVTDGDRVTWNVSFSNSSDVGADALTSATLTDGPMPAAFTADTITSGTWAWGQTATIEVSADGSAWTEVATGLTGASNTTITTGLDGARYVRWNWTGPISVGQGTSGMTISGTVTGAAVPSTSVQNCASAAALQGAATFSAASTCASVTLEVPQPHGTITKRVNAATSASVSPGSSATYTISVGNHSDATGPLTDPTVTDCVPAGFAVTSTTPGANWALDGGYANATCTNAGGTPLRFVYTGSLAANATAATITYTVQLNGFDDPDGEIVAPGSYTNTARVLASDGSALNHCVQSGCQSTATVTVPVVAQLTSQKEAKGALDAAWTTAGSTMPGGAVNWRLTLQNTGNVDALNPVFIDIFPHVGDTGVVVWNVARGSDIPSFLVTPITAPVGWTVSYSTSANPCRSEVGGPATGCDAPNWTTSPDTTQMPIYQSVKLLYTGLITRGTSTQFSWQSRVPVLDASYDTPDSTASPYDAILACGGDPAVCPAAVNSFAYGTYVDPNDLGGMSDPGLLSSEPPLVSVAVTETPRPNNVGDLVFADTDHDGLQDIDEPGIANVRVELDVYDGLSDTWSLNVPYGYTYTDASGNYLFPDLPDGTYRLRFFLPDSNAYATLQDVTGVAGDAAAPALNSGDDSDTPTTPTGSTADGNYYQTGPIELGGIVVDEIDESWDAGVWIPAPSISLVKLTNGSDTSTAPGLELFPGDPVTWTYTATNDGNTYLTDVTLVDVVTASSASDPTPVCNWAASTDAATPAGVLSRGESVTCTASSDVISGVYANQATVTATATLDPTDPADTGTYGTLDRVAGGADVSASDTGHYTGITYALGDLVFVDVDGSGTYNPPTDVPIRNGTVVRLYDDGDQLVASTTTTAGRYLFTGLRPGSYYVEIPPEEFAAEGGALAELGPAPSAVVDPNNNANESTDHHAVAAADLGVRSSGLLVLSSHVSGSSYVGDEPTGDDTGSIAAGQVDNRTNQTLDLGLAGPHPLIIQTDATCVDGYPQLSYRLDYRYFTPSTVGTVQIYAYTSGPDHVWGTGDDAPAATPTQTIANVPLGEWTDQLWPGTSLSPRDWPGWVLTNGVWQTQHDGLTPNVLIRATVDASNTAVAAYPVTSPTCTPPVASIGDRVWWDRNDDGTQQLDEPGIAGATVTVRWAGLDDVLGNGDDVVHPGITTDADGGWTLGSLPSGNYRVTVTLVDESELTLGYDLDGAGSAGATFALADAEDRTDVDFGYVATFTLGDLVFNDADGNGRYDAGLDTGVAGIDVELLDADGNTLATTTTDADGRYAFSGLLPGAYRVAIPAAEFDTGGTVDGWDIGLLPAADPDTDADETTDHHAVADTGGAATPAITLSATLAADGQFAGDEPGGMTNATLDLALRAPASIDLVKTVDDGSGWATSGHVGFLGGVTWRVVVTNDGGQSLHAIEITDAAAGGCAAASAPGDGVLDPGEAMTVECSSINLIADLTNTASVTALDPADAAVADTDQADVTVDPPVPGIVLVKYVTPDLVDPVHGDLRDANDLPGFIAAGGTEVTWVYALANTGNTPLDLSTFEDTNTTALPDDDFAVLASMYVSGDTDADGLLDVDEEWWFATPDATLVPEGATETSAQVLADPTDADGNRLDGVAPVTDTDPADVFGTTAVLTVTKTTNGFDAADAPGTFVRVGERVVWQYTVHNGSNTALADVSVVDDPAVTIDCPTGNPIPFLAIDDEVVCEASVDASAQLGQFRNDVTVTGTPVDDGGSPLVGPGIEPQTATDTSHFFGWDAAIEVVKAVDATDPLDPTVPEDAETAPGAIRPVGATVVWTYRVTNTGVVPLTSVGVTDSSGDDVVCPDEVVAGDPATIALLLPGETVVCTVITDVRVGGSLTTATAAGSPSYPDGADFSGDDIAAIAWPTDPDAYSTIDGASGPVADVTDTDDLHQFGWYGSITVTKRVNGAVEPAAPGLFVPAGAAIDWTYTVVNDGFVPLLDVTVVDDMEGTADCGDADADLDGDIDLLLPGDEQAVVCTLSGTAIDPTLDPHYANQVDVSGQPAYPASDAGFDSEPADAVTVWPTDPAVYAGVPVVGADFDAEIVDPVTDDDVAHYTVAVPAVSIVKTVNGDDANTAPGIFVITGAALVWHYSVRNTGNSPLADLVVVDDRLADGAVDCGDGTNVIAALDPGDATVCRATGVAIEGAYTNVGTVTATPVDEAGERYLDPATGEPVPEVTASDPASAFGASPSIALQKTVCGREAAGCDPAAATGWVERAYLPVGSDATWRIAVVNTGNVTLEQIAVDDPLVGACASEPDPLAPGASAVWTCVSPGISGPIDNVAHVSAVPVDDLGVQLRDADGRRVTVTADDGASVSPPTDLQLAKSSTELKIVGSAPIDWTLEVHNTGPGSAPATVVRDLLPVGMELVSVPDGTTYDAATRTLMWPVGMLNPGDHATLHYTTAATNDSGGDFTNTASVESEAVLLPTSLADDSAQATVHVNDAGELPHAGGAFEPIVLAAVAALGSGGILLLVGRRRRTAV